MKSITLFLNESIAYQNLIERILYNKELNHPNVRKFLDLGKKVLIDKQKLNDQEQKEIKELFGTYEVQMLIQIMSQNSIYKFSRLGPILLGAIFSNRFLIGYLMKFGLGFGSSLGISMITVILGALLLLTTLTRYFPTSEQKKIVEELKKLKLIKANMEIDKNWKNAFNGTLKVK